MFREGCDWKEQTSIQLEGRWSKSVLPGKDGRTDEAAKCPEGVGWGLLWRWSAMQSLPFPLSFLDTGFFSPPVRKCQLEAVIVVSLFPRSSQTLPNTAESGTEFLPVIIMQTGMAKLLSTFSSGASYPWGPVGGQITLHTLCCFCQCSAFTSRLFNYNKPQPWREFMYHFSHSDWPLWPFCYFLL